MILIIETDEEFYRTHQETDDSVVVVGDERTITMEVEVADTEIS